MESKDYKTLIEDSGLKLSYVADLLNISRQTLWAKLNGKSRFTEQEMMNLDTIIAARNSDEPALIITDPKGEFIRALDETLHKYGYKIVQMNLDKEAK